MTAPNLILLEIKFADSMRPARDLIAIHKRNTSVGRRVADLSLNKGVVVFAVAAWQSYVENLVDAILKSLAPPPGDATMGVYRLHSGLVQKEIKRYSTPNSANTLQLLSLVNFDPSPGWSFTVEWERQHSERYGSLRKRRPFHPSEAKRELDSWLLVRHAIAHGSALPAVGDRVSGRYKGNPQLTRRDADRCASFFDGLVGATSNEVRRAFP